MGKQSRAKLARALKPRRVRLAKATSEVKLDLGCGQKPAEGFEGVDLLASKATHKVDLFKFPWPWADDSVDELHASHFVEHIPSRPVGAGDFMWSVDNTIALVRTFPELLSVPPRFRDRINNHTPASSSLVDSFLGQEMFFAFFDECWRILKPCGTMKVIVPALQSVRAFQDPTHHQFISAERFLYLSRDWREANKLDHYRVRCDFSGSTLHTCEDSMNKLHPEAAARRFREGWNTIYDFHVSLVKETPETKAATKAKAEAEAKEKKGK